MDYVQLIINTGGVSTKVAIFINDKLIQEQVLKHDVEKLKEFATAMDQAEFRKQLILDFLAEHHYSVEQIDIFVGRGGLLRPLKQGGTYLVTEKMVDDLRNCRYGSHAANLGAIIAYELAKPINRPAYTVNPVSVDEFNDFARVSGLKGIERRSVFHVLNHKAIAKRHAKTIGKPYESMNLIVCHLGSGISVGLHEKGRVVDVNNALGGDGPFSTERTGTVPTYPLVDLCFSGKYTIQEVKKLLAGEGGLVSYLGTSNGIEIDKRIKEGDQEAAFYFQAMAYTVVKEIGAMYFVAKGKIDAVLITGGLANNETFVNHIKDYVTPIAPVFVYAGEDEMRALAEGALRVLNQEEKLQAY
ncbi:MAG TPA: butyrate kinase [Bacillota bacterium]|mgnify:CR=1 FL=1|nr:butyrate kinase [Bacillota bacterium]HPF42343.1 butyrate kinase [Bacillota bacterium]HPJ85322.1 butyrate kinase [Bacillota bacterium]HPQ61382.1 butyrate kinase [Bacillota bacterium]HRX92248.1 butyrate kinase [Candidatus Izemoplasmatales bacterium]